MNKELKEIIECDCYRYFGDEHRPFLYKYRINTLRYIICWRKANYYASKAFWKKEFYKYKLRRLERTSSLEISVETKIGKGLYIAHKGVLIISCYANLGRNIYFSSSATIGQENRGRRKGAPTLKDNIWIGANVVIVGKITVGNNVLIAPNTYINFDIPDDSIVIGNPAKIISSQNATEGYIYNRV